jgi:DNA-binding ferritin-like protein
MQSTKAKKESFPPPTQLATETDLSPHEVKAITEAVNPLIADAFALYVKTKNFHWHLYGSHFRDYHLLLDEHADAIFDSIDKNRDSATSNQLQDILDKTERRKWFLYEVMQGSKNTE